MIEEICCPRCGADIEFEAHQEAGRLKFGTPRFRQVPPLIPNHTAALAEHFRRLADDLDKGRFDAPDGAMVLLVDSDKRHLDFTNRFGLNTAWWMEACRRVLRELSPCH